MIDYTQIKQLSKARGLRVTDLIALAPQNDPFYTGTPNDWALAEWFKQLWRAFGYHQGVHLRRIHYQIVSQQPPVVLPNGLPYENTMECWEVLNMASKAARYLQLVDAAAFVDRKAPDVVVFANYQESDPEVAVTGYLAGYDFALPDFPDLPGYRVYGYRANQEYHLEVVCEKSTMNDILLPLCQHFGVNLQIGVGELSITAALSLVHRLVEVQRPARIFYVSDFDPAGQSMPVAFARKVEYFLRLFNLDLDVRLFPVVLTLEQVQRYGLPRTPIKETERRRMSFEEQHGEGAVELDALEALYPGELAATLSAAIEQYYDTSLEERVDEVKTALRSELGTVEDGVLGVYAGEVEAFRQEYEVLQASFTAQMQGYRQRLERVWQAMRRDLRDRIPDLDNYGVPQAALANEIGEGLYNSQREYLEQIGAYKEFQGKALVEE